MFIRFALISAGERFGYTPRSSATTPDTIGAAPDVPPNASVPSPVATSADTDAPGAPMSGLIALKLYDGPRDDEPATPPISAIAPLVSRS